jgi:hypothetical protein
MIRAKCYLASGALEILIEEFNNWLFSDGHQRRILEIIRTVPRIDNSQSNKCVLSVNMIMIFIFNLELAIVSFFLRNIEIKNEFLQIMKERIYKMGFETIKNSNPFDRQVCFCSIIFIFTYLMFLVSDSLY